MTSLGRVAFWPTFAEMVWARSLMAVVFRDEAAQLNFAFEQVVLVPVVEQ